MKLRLYLSPSQIDALRVLAKRRETTPTVVLRQAICRNVTTALLREQKIQIDSVSSFDVSKPFSIPQHIYEVLYLFADRQNQTVQSCARWCLQQEIDKFLFTTQTESAEERDLVR